MTKFATQKIDAINGRQNFVELVVDGKGQLSEYEKKLQKKYLSQFKSILTYMELAANNLSLPDKKFKDVTPYGEKIKEYEFKKGDLRIYAIDMLNGKIVVLGGYKNNQKKDFRKFRSLKQQYLTENNPNEKK